MQLFERANYENQAGIYKNINGGKILSGNYVVTASALKHDVYVMVRN